jgi:hypothetical protein
VSCKFRKGVGGAQAASSNGRRKKTTFAKFNVMVYHQIVVVRFGAVIFDIF